EEVLVFLLATERELGTRRAILERILPVERAHDALDVGRGKTGGIEAADDGAHAGARDRVDGHVQLVQHLQHADMRRAARPPTGKHEADAGATHGDYANRTRRVAGWRALRAWTPRARTLRGGIRASGLRRHIRRSFRLRAIFGGGLGNLDGTR